MNKNYTSDAVELWQNSCGDGVQKGFYIICESCVDEQAKSVAGEKETLQLVCKTSEDKYSLHLRKYFSSVPSISTLHTMSKSSDLYKPQYAQSEQSQIRSVAVCYCRLSVFVSHMTLELVLLK